MNANQIKVLRYLIHNPHSELQQICVGTRLPVASVDPALSALLDSGSIEMSYGNGGAGTQYHAPKAKKMLDKIYQEVGRLLK